jgi:hypothetical protein
MKIRTAGLALVASLALAAPASAASIKGTWSGSYHVIKGGRGTFAVRVHITQLRKGRRAGTVSYPGSQCRGKVVLLRHARSGYSFRYHERGRGCTGNDTILMRRQGARLYWRATSPGGGQVGVALLRRAR